MKRAACDKGKDNTLPSTFGSRGRGSLSSETISNVKHVKWLTKGLESVFTDVFFPSDKTEYLHPFYPSTAENPLFQQ